MRILTVQSKPTFRAYCFARLLREAGHETALLRYDSAEDPQWGPGLARVWGEVLHAQSSDDIVNAGANADIALCHSFAEFLNADLAMGDHRPDNVIFDRHEPLPHWLDDEDWPSQERSAIRRARIRLWPTEELHRIMAEHVAVSRNPSVVIPDALPGWLLSANPLPERERLASEASRVRVADASRPRIAYAGPFSTDDTLPHGIADTVTHLAALGVRVDVYPETRIAISGHAMPLNPNLTLHQPPGPPVLLGALRTGGYHAGLLLPGPKPEHVAYFAAHVPPALFFYHAAGLPVLVPRGTAAARRARELACAVEYDLPREIPALLEAASVREYRQTVEPPRFETQGAVLVELLKAF